MELATFYQNALHLTSEWRVQRKMLFTTDLAGLFRCL